jgi:hypothetical protein
MHGRQPPACVVVDIQNGDQAESRLVVYANGRILYHRIENAPSNIAKLPELLRKP